jgi:thioesterase domain-containing protein
MSDTPQFSEAKRTLLEKYLRGDIPRTLTNRGAITQESPEPLSHKGSRTPVMAIQSSGSKRPFFFFHVHWVGGAFYCFALARELGPDQPFYMLEPYSFDGLSVPPTLESMAAAYIKSLRAIQPEGPYLLGGFCGGGLIAYEIAQQLSAEGQEVDLLALIDPWAGPIQLIRLVRSFIRRLGDLLRLDSAKQLDWFLRLRHMYRFLLRLQGDSPHHFSFLPTTEALRQDWMGIFTWVSSNYVPSRYPGKVTYFWASEKPGSRKMWWGKVAETADKTEDKEVHVIPGKHMTLVTEHMHDLTEQLHVCLSKAQAAASS